MRIGVDIRPLADRPPSGVGEYTLELLSALLERDDGHTYVLFTCSFRQPPTLPGRWAKEKFRLVSIRVPSKIMNAGFRFLGLPNIEHLTGPLDLFFAPNINFLPTPMRVPFVLTVHDCSFVHFRHLLSWNRRLWHGLVRPEQLMRAAASVLAVSHATADDIRVTYRLPAEKIHTIHSGVRVRKTTDEGRVAADALEIPQRFLLSVATLEPRKNLLAVLAAYRILRERNWYHGALVLAGMPGWSSGPFHRMLGVHPFRSSIRVLGYVPQDVKDVLLERADCLLFPSVFEGFGFPPLEALMRGTPVVAGHHSSLTELVGDTALLCDVQNVRDIAVAVRAVLDDQGLRERVRRRAHELSRLYSWEHAADATVRVFENTAR